MPGSLEVTSTLQVDSNTASSFVYSNASKQVVTTAAPTNGQLLIGSTGNVPVAATLTAGNGIAITNGAGSISVASAVLSAQNPAADIVNAPNNTTTNFATSYTFPANAITATSVHRITMLFKYIDSGGALTVSFKSTLGGTDACSFGAASHASAGTFIWTLSVYVIGTAVPSASSAVNIVPTLGGTNTASAAPFAQAISAVPTNFATNGSLVYQPQFQASVNTAGNSLQLLSMIVEQLNA